MMEDSTSARRPNRETASSLASRTDIPALLERVADHLNISEHHQTPEWAPTDGFANSDARHGDFAVFAARTGGNHRPALKPAQADDTDSPWDRASAEALAAVYWGDPVPRRVHRPETFEAASAGDGQSGETTAFEAVAIEQQLDRLAARLEQSLQAIDPGNALLDLLRRMQAIETAIAAPRSSFSEDELIDSLKAIDAEISTLTKAIDDIGAKTDKVSAVERTVAELATGIDTKLAKPVHQPLGDGDVERMALAVSQLMTAQLDAQRQADLSDTAVDRVAHRLATAVGQAIPAPEPVRHSDEDLKRVAESIARVLVQRVTAVIQAPRPEDQGAGEIKRLVETALHEQRQNDDQVTSMLDTMQQALIGLLDRMDAIEKLQTASPAAAPERSPSQIASAFPEMQSPPPSPPPADAVAARPVATAALERPNAAAEQTIASAPAPLAQVPQAPENSRDDLIASARRAAAEAQRNAPEKTKAKRSTVTSQARGPRTSLLLNRRLLIGLLAIVTAASAYMAMTRKPSAPAPGTPGVERPATNAPKPQKSGAIESDGETDVADAGEIIDPDDAPSAGTVAQTIQPVSPLELLRRQEQEGFARLAGQMQSSAPPEPQVQKTSLVSPEQDAVSDQGRERELPPALVGPMSLRLAAQSGDPSAEFAVGARLGEGRGLPQDLAQAIRWYQRSAQQGFALAQYRLGTYYERGLGVPKDIARAKAWYQRAAEQGNVKAMHNLAVTMASREGGTPNYAGAAEWFAKAADHGLRDSLFNLAVLHESGLGVEQDFAKAYRYLALAARAGDAQAVKRLAQVRARLAPEIAARIDEAVQNWRSQPKDRMANDPIVAGEAWKGRATADAG